MFLLFLLIPVILSIVSPVVRSQEQITCHPLIRPVTIDGKWTTPEEWNDALAMPLYRPVSSQLNGTGSFYAKHDNGYVYVAIDFVSDLQNNANDGAGVFFDANHDSGSRANVDDYAFGLSWTTGSSSKFIMWRGTGSGWQSAGGKYVELEPVSGSMAASSLSSSPLSSNPHMIYEFRVPKTILSRNYLTIGFMVGAYHNPSGRSPPELILNWPRDGLSDVPGRWGELTLSGGATTSQSSTSSVFSTSSTSAVAPGFPSLQMIDPRILQMGGAAVTGGSVLLGWLFKTRKRRFLSSYLTRIDATYNEYYANQEECKDKLARMKEEVLKLLKTGKIDEGQFSVLDNKITQRLKEIT